MAKAALPYRTKPTTCTQVTCSFSIKIRTIFWKTCTMNIGSIITSTFGDIRRRIFASCLQSGLGLLRTDSTRKASLLAFKKYTSSSMPIVDEAEISLLIYNILIYLYRACNIDRTQQPTEPALLAESYLCEHYKEDLTLDHLASYVNVSKYHLAHLYKKTWGISPIQRLLSIRFEKCLEQLKTTSLPVSDILTENHFVNYHLFIKMCRERTGLSPTQYRKTQKQDLD